MAINIFIATRDEKTFAPINKSCAKIENVDVIGQFIETSGSNILNLSKMIKPDLLIVDDTITSSTMGKMVVEMTRIFPMSGVIGLNSVGADNSKLNKIESARFMKLIKPYTSDDLRFAIDYLMHEIMENYFTQNITKKRRKKPSTPKILPVFSSTQNIDKTSMIVNLGWMLSQEFDQKVLILNLGSVFDDTDIFLNYKSEIDFDYLVEQYHSPSSKFDYIGNMIPEHPKYKNLFIISGSSKPTQFKNNRELKNSLEFFLWKFEKKFDWILINTPPYINKDVFTLINISENPFMIVENHVISIRNTELFFEIVKTFGADISKFSFIATRLSNEVGIKTDKLLNIFGGTNRFFSFIPTKGKLQMESIDKRTPLMTLVKKDAEIFKIYKAMSSRLTGIKNTKTSNNFLIKGVKKFFGMK